MPTDTTVLGPERTHHLDKRADEVADKGAGDPEDLLNTTEIAEWLGVSTQWVEIGRHRGYGPPTTSFPIGPTPR
jgi:hypothetical protein